MLRPALHKLCRRATTMTNAATQPPYLFTCSRKTFAMRFALRNFGSVEAPKNSAANQAEQPSENAKKDTQDTNTNNESVLHSNKAEKSKVTDADSSKVAGSTSDSQKPHDHTKPTSAASSLQDTLNYTQEKLHVANQYTAQLYTQLESQLMHAIKEENKQNFRVGLGVTVLFVLWVVAAFGNTLRKKFTQTTAGLAKETLENSELKVQTQELATAVVQTILTDKEVTAQAAAFLREASLAPDTQLAMLKLALHILQHEESLAEVTVLAKRLIASLASDKETVDKCVALFSAVTEDPRLRASLVALVTELCKEPEVVQAVTDLALALLARNDVYTATTDLLAKSSVAVLDDKTVQDQSRSFVAEVVGDDALQREGGDALINSVTHALRPGLLRMTGAGVVLVCFAVIKLLLSPY